MDDLLHERFILFEPVEREKPTFEKGDRVMVIQRVVSAAPGRAPHLPGEKGVVLADDAKLLPFQVQFADGHVMWFSQGAMERYFAKAVGNISA